MTDIDPYLFFDGTCAEAMRLYQRLLGGKLDVMLYRDGPSGSCAPGSEDRVMHACLTTDNGRRLMASDTAGLDPFRGNAGFAIALNVPTAAEAKRVFDALADGGQVRMPLDKTFWAECFGMLTDRYGIPWMIGGGASQ